MASVTAGIKNTAVFRQDWSWPMVPLDVRCQFVSLPHTSQCDKFLFKWKSFVHLLPPIINIWEKDKQNNNNQPTLDINPFGSGFLLNNSVCSSFTFHYSPQTLSKNSGQSPAFESSPLSPLGGHCAEAGQGSSGCGEWTRTWSGHAPKTVQHGLSVDILFYFIGGITLVIVIVEMVSSSCQFQHLSLRSSLFGSVEL